MFVFYYKTKTSSCSSFVG